MLEKILQIDQELLIFLNGLNSPFFDVLMWWLTSVWFWLPFLSVILWFMWKHYKKKIILILAFLALSILFSDQISGLIKNKVARLRPTHNTEASHHLHLHVYKNDNVYKGGQYGFVSSHAANSFCIALLLIYFFKPINRRIRWLFVLYPLIFSYTRIYLGVHYPLDIIGGTIVGLCCGFIVLLLAINYKKILC
jgi:undecaprenyl-diphosphatase